MKPNNTPPLGANLLNMNMTNLEKEQKILLNVIEEKEYENL